MNNRRFEETTFQGGGTFSLAPKELRLFQGNGHAFAFLHLASTPLLANCDGPSLLRRHDSRSNPWPLPFFPRNIARESADGTFDRSPYDVSILPEGPSVGDALDTSSRHLHVLYENSIVYGSPFVCIIALAYSERQQSQYWIASPDYIACLPHPFVRMTAHVSFPPPPLHKREKERERERERSWNRLYSFARIFNTKHRERWHRRGKLSAKHTGVPPH